jgi:hypothetical protein
VTTFYIGTCSDLKWILNLKNRKSRSVFDFRKLIKIAKNGQKNPGICMEVGNSIWNTSHVGNFFQISTDFELIKGSYVQQV